LVHTSLTDFPRFNETGEQPKIFVKRYLMEDNSLEPVEEVDLAGSITNYSFAANDNYLGYSNNTSENMLYLKANGSANWSEIAMPAEGVGDLEKIVFDTDDAYLCFNKNNDQVYIYKGSLEDQDWGLYLIRDTNGYGYDFHVSSADQKLFQFISTQSENLKINLIHSEGDDGLNHNYEYLTTISHDSHGGSFPMYVDDDSQVHLLYHALVMDNFYYIHGSLDGLVELEPEEIVPELKPTLSNYPNPFNPTTTISFNSKQYEQDEEIEIEIFNLKGQKVKQFSDLRGQSAVIWNGTDQNNNPVASSIYYYTLKVDGKASLSRKMILLK